MFYRRFIVGIICINTVLAFFILTFWQKNFLKWSLTSHSPLTSWLDSVLQQSHLHVLSHCFIEKHFSLNATLKCFFSLSDFEGIKKVINIMYNAKLLSHLSNPFSNTADYKESYSIKNKQFSKELSANKWMMLLHLHSDKYVINSCATCQSEHLLPK